MAASRLKLNADKTELLWAGSKYGSTLLGIAVDRHYGLEMRLSRPVIMYAYLASPSRRISACEARRYYEFIVLLLAASDPKNTTIT